MSYAAQKRLRHRRRKQLVELKGSKCERCLGVFPPEVYDFHHRNPSLKTFSLNLSSLSSYKWDVIEAEVNKCHLLCANCHRQVHTSQDKRFLEVSNADATS